MISSRHISLPHDLRTLACWLTLGSIGAAAFSQHASAASVGTNVSGPASADAASVFWNPAAMMLTNGTEVMLYGGVGLVRAHYERDYMAPDGSAYPQANETAPTPEFFAGAVTNATLERFRFGIGVTPPLIDGATWNETEDGQPSPARYYGLTSYLAWLTISPAAAYRINRYVSIGLGIDVVIGLMRNRSVIDFGARLNQQLCKAAGDVAAENCPVDAPLAREDPTYDAPLSADAVAVGVGVFGGVLVTPAPWLRIGASIRSGAGEMEFPTTISLELPDAVGDFLERNLPSLKLPPLQTEATVSVTYPMMIAIGALLTPKPWLDLGADFQWLDKSSMSVFTAIVHADPDKPQLFSDVVNYNPSYDTYRFNIWGAYRFKPNLSASLSFSYEPNSRPEGTATPTTIDMHKFLLRAGVSWWMTPRLALVGDYGHYFIVTREITRSSFAPNANPTTPEEEALDRPSGTGTYSAEADRFAVGLIARF